MENSVVQTTTQHCHTTTIPYIHVHYTTRCRYPSPTTCHVHKHCTLQGCVALVDQNSSVLKSQLNVQRPLTYAVAARQYEQCEWLNYFIKLVSLVWTYTRNLCAEDSIRVKGHRCPLLPITFHSQIACAGFELMITGKLPNQEGRETESDEKGKKKTEMEHHHVG